MNIWSYEVCLTIFALLRQAPWGVNKQRGGRERGINREGGIEKGEGERWLLEGDERSKGNQRGERGCINIYNIIYIYIYNCIHHYYITI